MSISESPTYEYLAATPSETPLAKPCRGLYLANAGTVEVTGKNGVKVSFDNMAAGMSHPICARILHTAPAGTVLLY